MIEYPELWTALYLPADDRPDPSKVDCISREEAERYMFSMMCKTCREERERALSGTSDPNNETHEHDSEYPPCSCEWMILKTADYLKAETQEDLFEAAGAKIIYRRP